MKEFVVKANCVFTIRSTEKRVVIWIQYALTNLWFCVAKNKELEKHVNI